MTATKLTASVVGGGMGGQLSLGALAASDCYELVAAADLREEVRAQLEAKFPGLRTFPDHQTLFRECPTEVVCVSTYPPSHEPVTMDALAMLPLKGILVEKPLGHTYASGQRILQAVRAKGLPMVVPHGMLAKRTTLKILERVYGGEIGDLKLVEIQCNTWDIINAGIHWLNFFVMLTRQEPVAFVMALCDSSTRTYRDGMQVETAAVTYAQTLSGIRVVMNTGDDVKINEPAEEAGHMFLFRLIGTLGQIEFYGWESPYRLLNAANPAGIVITPQEMPITGHRFHLENMARQIADGAPNYAIPESSLRALELCEAAYLSSQYGCRVRLPLENFVPPAPNDWQPGQPYAGHGGGRDGRKL